MSAPRHPLDQLWLAFSSTRTTALLATLLAIFAAVAAIVPQGSAAIELVQFEEAVDLRRLATWGFTAVFESAWIRVVGVLLVANVLSVVLRGMNTRAEENLETPSGAPLEAELEAPLPERAVESLRVNLRAALGTAPAAEKIDGAKVTMVFDTSPRGEIWPLVAHIGLVLLVVGAGLLVTPAPRSKSVVRAMLKVTDSKTGSQGFFDMAQGEPIKFFQWRTDFVIRDYVASKNGLGPAIRIERFDPGGQRRSDFWVYRDAPASFDKLHRRGFVSIEAISMGLQAAPGYGLSSKPMSVLLLLGLALVVLGAMGSGRAAGRLWVEAEGDRVRLLGVPRTKDDPGFAKSFGRLELLSRMALGQG